MGGTQGVGSEFPPCVLWNWDWQFRSAGIGRGSPRLGILPWQPGLGDQLERFGESRDDSEILEGIDAIEPAGLDEAHEPIPGPGSVEGFIIGCRVGGVASRECDPTQGVRTGIF